METSPDFIVLSSNHLQQNTVCCYQKNLFARICIGKEIIKVFLYAIALIEEDYEIVRLEMP
jgi:hypothetical protein